jgi:hypothetical protein
MAFNNMFKFPKSSLIKFKQQKGFMKVIPNSGKILVITFIICAILLAINKLPLPKDDYGRLCGVDVAGFNSLIFFFGGLLVFMLSLIELVLKFVKKHSKGTNVAVLILSLIFIYLWFFYQTSRKDTRLITPDVSIKSDMYKLVPAQEMFYIKNTRYADTQRELTEGGFLENALKNWATEQEFADKDGIGIEGSDNDPETWLVTTFIPVTKFKWCKKIETGYWYTCNQKGCHSEE